MSAALRARTASSACTKCRSSTTTPVSAHGRAQDGRLGPAVSSEAAAAQQQLSRSRQNKATEKAQQFLQPYAPVSGEVRWLERRAGGRAAPAARAAASATTARTWLHHGQQDGAAITGSFPQKEHRKERVANGLPPKMLPSSCLDGLLVAGLKAPRLPHPPHKHPPHGPPPTLLTSRGSSPAVCRASSSSASSPSPSPHALLSARASSDWRAAWSGASAASSCVKQRRSGAGTLSGEVLQATSTSGAGNGVGSSLAANALPPSGWCWPASGWNPALTHSASTVPSRAAKESPPPGPPASKSRQCLDVQKAATCPGSLHKARHRNTAKGVAGGHEP